MAKQKKQDSITPIFETKKSLCKVGVAFPTPSEPTGRQGINHEESQGSCEERSSESWGFLKDLGFFV